MTFFWGKGTFSVYPCKVTENNGKCPKQNPLWIEGRGSVSPGKPTKGVDPE